MSMIPELGSFEAWLRFSAVFFDVKFVLKVDKEIKHGNEMYVYVT